MKWMRESRKQNDKIYEMVDRIFPLTSTTLCMYEECYDQL